jgi:hypothetical protein
MDIVGENIVQLGSREVGLVSGEVEFRQLDFGAGVGMIFGYFLPNLQSGIGFAERLQCFGERHHRVTVLVLWILGDHTLDQRAGFGSALLSQKTLAEVCPGINVLGIPFHGSAVAGFGFVEFTLLEEDIAKLGMVMSFVEVMNLRLQFLDLASIAGAGKFESPGCR